MKKYEIYYTSLDGAAESTPVTVKSSTVENAVAEFIKNNPSKAPNIRVQTLMGTKNFENPMAKEAQRQADEAQRQADEAQRQAELTLLKSIIGKLQSAGPEDLTFSELETVMGNHLVFPEFDESEDTEIYSLREALYMRSLWHPNLQTVIQTRIISDKLDALQAAITGVANTQVGIANDQAKRHRTSILGQAATVAALGKIAQDTEGVGDFFGD